MRRRSLGVLTAAAGVTVAASLLAPPAFAAGPDKRGGATTEEFVCYRSTGEKIRLGTGKTITTPNGESRVVCTGKPL